MSTYEFSESENVVIKVFSTRISIFALSITLLGVVALISALFPEFALSQIFSAILFLLVGLLFFYPIKNFRNVIKTEGNDIEELMNGFKKLDNGFTLILILTALLPLILILERFL